MLGQSEVCHSWHMPVRLWICSDPWWTEGRKKQKTEKYIHRINLCIVILIININIWDMYCAVFNPHSCVDKLISNLFFIFISTLQSLPVLQTSYMQRGMRSFKNRIWILRFTSTVCSWNNFSHYCTFSHNKHL